MILHVCVWSANYTFLPPTYPNYFGGVWGWGGDRLEKYITVQELMPTMILT